VLDFDADAARQSKRGAALARRQAEAQQGRPASVTVVSDASSSTIEIQLDRVQKKIAWHGLRDDAREYPGVAAIQRLAAAERELRALMERPELEKVR
jgi:hypothetical protein